MLKKSKTLPLLPLWALLACSWLNFTFYCGIIITSFIIRVIAFTGKTNVLYYTYKLWDSSVSPTDTIKDLAVQLNSKLHFRAHVRRHFLPIRKDAGLNNSITYLFSAFYSLLILYLNLVDRLCGLVVRVSGYRYRGFGFDSRRYQIF